MRILEIIPQLSSGGGERFTVDLCNELCKNHIVKLIVLNSLTEYGFYSKELNTKVEVISFDKRPGLRPEIFFKLFKEIQRFKPDIVHSHLRSIIYLPLAVLLNRHNIRFFHTIHSDAVKEASDKFSRNIRKWLFSSDKVKPITISEESHNSFIKFYKRDAVMIPNGRAIPSDLTVSEKTWQEIKSFKKTPNTKIIINLARIIEVKRQPLIARISRRLHEEGYDFSMLFIGRCEDDNYYQTLKNEMGENSSYLGERTNPLEYLKAGDAYCLFSSYEGLPISLIEAMSMGAVPVCTPVGGIVNVVKNGISGILASDTSEKACYEALRHFLEVSNGQLSDIKKNAINASASYRIDVCAHQYEKLFGEK